MSATAVGTAAMITSASTYLPQVTREETMAVTPAIFRAAYDVIDVGSERVLLRARESHRYVHCTRTVADRLGARKAWTARELGDMLAAAAVGDVSVESLLEGGLIEPLRLRRPDRLARTVCVLTADRPRCCVRAIDMAHRAVRSASTEDVRIRIVENSRSPSAVARLTTALARTPYGQAVSVVCARCAAARLTSRLASVDRRLARVLAFAIGSDASGEVSAGAGRNLIGLLHLDRAVLSLDDDVCDPVLSPAHTGIAYACGSQCIETTPRSLCDRGTWAPVNLVDEHFAWLGMRLGEAGEQVVLTVSGLVGDCGTEAPWHELHTAADPRGLRITRQIVRGVTRPTVTPVDGLMTYACGLLNDGRLPPFMPLGRNQDGAFAASLRAWEPRAHTCHVPAYVTHMPEGRRSERAYRDVVRAVFSRWRTNDVIAMLASPAPAWAGRDRLYERVLDLAGDVRRGHLSSLQALHMHLISTRIQRAEPYVATRGWSTRRRFDRGIRGLVTSVQSPVLPREWTGRGVEAFARYLEAAGMMLSHWPEVIDAVRALQRPADVFARCGCMP